MQQLSGIDSAFLALESGNTPMHVTALMMYQGSVDSHGGDLLQSVRDRFESILKPFPIFRQKLTEKNFLDDHPYWIDDDGFDLDNHVQKVSLPAPGDWQQLRLLAARLHEEPLHLKFPLWDVYVIDGLADKADFPANSFAILMKVHHAAVDGVSMTNILGTLHSGIDNKLEPGTTWQPQAKPLPMEMMWKSYGNKFKRRMQFWQTIGKVIPALKEAGQESKVRAPLTQKFATRFNEKVSADRVFDSVEFALDEIIACKTKLPGATVNDVVVSIVGGGLRKYLDSVGELTHQTLVTGAPINTRGEAGKKVSANQISMMRIPLGTDVDDALERLAAVMSGSAESKAYAKNMGLNTLSDVAQSLDPSLLALGIRAVTSDVLSDIINTPVHTMVSNVPGPREPMFLGDARLTRIMGLGPLVDQVGLFNAVTSTVNSISVSFVSTHEMLPDPAVYSACLLEAYQDICKA